ncbi:MAG: MBG domain-containing protein, partial [Clostridiales bacterium]|nr:MBG domain-containing protein [Clostridiales bacterium]
EYDTDAPTEAGAYTVKLVLNETGNYNAYETTAVFTIAKASFTATASITGWTYNEEANAPSVSNNPEGGTVTYYYKAATAEDDEYNIAVPTEAGDYSVKAAISETANYLGYETAAVGFAIAKASFTATASITGWTYNDEPNVPSVSYNPEGGVVAYYYKADGAESYGAEVPSLAGNYLVKAAISETANYLGYETAATVFVIDKDTYTAEVVISNWVFGAPAVVATVSYNPEGGAVIYYYKNTFTEFEFDANFVPTEAGDYSVYAVIAETDNYYGVMTEAANFEIEKQGFYSETIITGWTYNDEPNAPSVSYNPEDGTVTYYYKAAGEGEYSTVVPHLAGEYSVYAVIASTDNYSGSVTVAVLFTIDKDTYGTEISITGWVYKAYNAEVNTPRISYNPENGGIDYYYKNTVTDKIFAKNEIPTDAGSYSVYAVIAETANYYGTTTDTDEFVIAKAEGAGIVEIKGWDGGKDGNEPSVKGNISGGAVTYLYSYAEFGVYGYEKPTEIGIYYVKAVIAETDNYNEYTTAATKFEISENITYTVIIGALIGAATLALFIAISVISVKKKVIKF